jgi:hypothetical protein
MVEEMMTADGAFRHIRTNTFGFSFKDGDGTGEYFTTGSHGFEDVVPDLALRGKLLALRGVPEKMAALATKVVDGELDVHLEAKPERSTYIMSSLGEWTGIIGGARAVGREDLAAAATARMERDCATGERFPAKPLQAGVQSIAVHLWVRWASPMSLADISLRGYVAPVGPVLEHVPWPGVLVTKARSDDGIALDLVVEPGSPSDAGEHPFVLSAMTPGARYRVHGRGVDVELVADDAGRATASVPVTARRHLRVEPVQAP